MTPPTAGADETPTPEATAGESAAPGALVATAGAAALPFTGLGLLEMLLGGLMAIALGAASLGLASRRS